MPPPLALFREQPGDGGDTAGYLVTIAADGSRARRLTRGRRDDHGQSWSPDGGRIVFIRDWDLHVGSVWVVRRDGTGLVRLTRGGNDGSAAWSPDGRRIAFTRAHGDGRRSDLFVVRPDGGGRKRLSRGGDFPTWSPDGGSIAFVRDQQLFVVAADGTGLRRLTQVRTGVSAPSWSPQGERIAFQVAAAGESANTYVIDASGGRPRVLGPGSVPTWSPDGRQITFLTCGLCDRRQLWVMNADGSGRRRLTVNGFDPAWQPL